MRSDNRQHGEMRPVEFIRHFTKQAPGSVLVSYGDTKVLCTASIEEGVPPFMRGSNKGWLTAEYSLLPGSTSPRARREVSKGSVSGRTSEIQRLIGRSLRSIVDFDLLGERSITIDADVLQADGGTRTAAITGGMVALYDAVNHLLKEGVIKKNPIKEWLGAVSVGVVNGEVLCDLCYEEDFAAEVDMNVVMTESGRFVEVQGTAEEEPFSRETLNSLLDTADAGIRSVLAMAKSVVA